MIMEKFFSEHSKFKNDIEVDDDFDISNFDDYDEYDEDTWAEELKYKLENAIEVWIASAYLDFRAVDILKNTLDSLPTGYSREIRILLDNEFHANAIAREVVVNKLFEIPNIKIRLADTKGKFHPKCYVFNDGSLTSCLVGSMNLTGSAMERNVEFGLFVDDIEQINRCKNFFRKYWNKAKNAVKTELMEFVGNKYNISDRVIYKKTEKTGVIFKVEYVPDKQKYIYSVFFDETNFIDIPEEDLIKAHITTPSEFDIQSFVSTDTTRGFKEIIYNYLYSRYFLPCENGMYISKSSRIVDTWYQKIPLIKITSSQKPKLLIADEVGLGKTIEAGLIIREMISKMPLCNKLLILCPNNLVNKWEAEMRIRFDLFFDIFTGRDAVNFMKDWNKNSSFKAIMSYESLRKEEIPNLIREKGVPIDVLVCDEAHHLRNDSNLQHKSVRAIAKDNRCMLMLTATPINLSNQDLRVLLGLLEPDFYKSLDSTSWDYFKTPNVFISHLYAAISDCLDDSDSADIYFSDDVFKVVKKLKTSVLDSIAFSLNYPPDHPLNITVDAILDHPPDVPLSSERVIEYLEKIQFSNVFSQSITRTLKKDVGEFNKRKVTSIKVKLEHEDELKLFDQLIKDIQVFYNKENKNKLVAHSYLRQVSSCLPMCDSFSKLKEAKRDDGDLPVVKKSKQDIDILENVLESKDSKFNELNKILLKAKDEDGINFKVIIFCIFRKTIKYLLKRINKEFGVGTAEAVFGEITDVNERYTIIRKFREQEKPNILICSEVASEGVDLQTCRILINYDLPWNPTKVEQRIGRIDRFGQKSDIVYIYNLVVQNTVEEAIYARLGKRLEDVRNTLGPVAEVLGELEDVLPEIFLRKDLEADEKEKYLNKIELNIERAKREENKLENRCFNLSVTGQKLLNKKWEILPYLVDHEEKIAKYIVAMEKNVFRLIERRNKVDLKVTPTQKSKLIRQLKKYLYKKDHKNRYLHMKSVIHQNTFDVVFNHEDALVSGGEFLNINNPIIKTQIIKSGKNINKKVIYCLETLAKEIPQGKYIILEYECSIYLGSIKYNSCFYEIAFNVNNDSLTVIEDTKILSALFDFTKWSETPSVGIDSSHLREAEIIAREKSGKFFLDQYEKISGKIKNELQLKKDSLVNIQGKEKIGLNGKLRKTVDPNKRETYISAMKSIEDDINSALRNIPSEDSIRFSPSILFCAKVKRK